MSALERYEFAKEMVPGIAELVASAEKVAAHSPGSVEHTAALGEHNANINRHLMKHPRAERVYEAGDINRHARAHGISAKAEKYTTLDHIRTATGQHQLGMVGPARDSHHWVGKADTAETPVQRYQRHQKQVAGLFTASAAIPALLALKSGRAASVAMSHGDIPLHTKHATGQLTHAATATALGGLAGAVGAAPVPKKFVTAVHRKRTAPAKVVPRTALHHTAPGKKPAKGYTKAGIGKLDSRKVQGTAMLGGGAAGLTVATNQNRIANTWARRAKESNTVKLRTAKGPARNELQRAANLIPKAQRRVAAHTLVGGLLAGVPLTYLGARKLAHPVDKRVTTRDVDTGAAGALGGAAVYHGIGYGSKPSGTESLTHTQKQTLKGHRLKYGIKEGHPAGMPEWKPFYRNYPKELPGAGAKRVFAHTHGGKTGLALQGATIAAGALGSAALGRKIRHDNPGQQR